MRKLYMYFLVWLYGVKDQSAKYHYFCDECTDYLNNQDGFSEKTKEWECTRFI